MNTNIFSDLYLSYYNSYFNDLSFVYYVCIFIKDQDVYPRVLV